MQTAQTDGLLIMDGTQEGHVEQINEISEKQETKRRQRDKTHKGNVDRDGSLVFVQPNTNADNQTKHSKSCWCHAGINVTYQIASLSKLL